MRKNIKSSNLSQSFFKQFVHFRIKVVVFVSIISLSSVIGVLTLSLNVQASIEPYQEISKEYVSASPNKVVYITSTMLLEDNGVSVQEIVPLGSDSGWEFGRFFILEEDNGFYLWLNNRNVTGGARIATEQRLESQDGLVWTNRLDTNLIDSTYDYHVLHGIRQVIHDGDIYHGWESTYYNVVTSPRYMWIEGIRYITSTDGLIWNIVNQPALVDGKSQSLYKEAGNYLMWENPDGDSGYSGSEELRFRISSEPGAGWGDWLTGGTLVTIDGSITTESANRVRRLHDGTYQLFYLNGTQMNSAISADGIHFATTTSNFLDMNVILPQYLLLWDFAVVDVGGEDWFYFTYKDTSDGCHIAVSRPELAVVGLTAVNDSPTRLGHITTLTPTITQGNDVTYTWDFGDGATGVGAVVTHTYPAVGVYTAVVTASNLVNTLTATTPVYIGEVITGLSAASDSPTYVGQTTNLTATIVTGTNVNYEWNFGDGTNETGRVLGHIYPAVGVYTAVVSAQNEFTTLTATTEITVIPYNNYLPVIENNYCTPSGLSVDVILALDTSGSMASPVDDNNETKLEAAQLAASTFIDLLNFPADQAGLVSFADSAILQYPLTIDAVNLKNTLFSLTADGETRIDLAFIVSQAELTSPRRHQESAQALILLSDGNPTGVEENAVLLAAQAAKSSGIVVFTIGLGPDVNETLLQSIASSPSHYYYAPAGDDLVEIYEQIANAIYCP
ncbi:MAG: VWA domain-containing protein [Ardenticatenaceae bacterium]|nr:VWA domain-containing protein [Ardenticatenaceae bacterium]